MAALIRMNKTWLGDLGIFTENNVLIYWGQFYNCLKISLQYSDCKVCDIIYNKTHLRIIY